jgi:hypothetical protein
MKMKNERETEKKAQAKSEQTNVAKAKKEYEVNWKDEEGDERFERFKTFEKAKEQAFWLLCESHKIDLFEVKIKKEIK